jgi:NAD(P)-dependent dehydrogenase (short-subunit alcohol dehydrogenase family)
MSSVAVITGASGALGSALARHLSSAGYRLALVDSPHAKDRLDVLSAQIDSAIGYSADVSSAEAWRDLLPRIEEKLGAASSAVLVAGGWSGGHPLYETSDDEWTRMMTSNLETARRALQAMLPGMVARKNGSIVVVGSRVVERPWTSAKAAAYAASKAAVVALAQVAAAEVLESGVRVNSVLPSTLDTEANRKAMPKADPRKWVATDSLARVIAFLLSDDSHDVSGAAIPVYGRA